MKNVKKGEEFVANYGYPYKNAPLWYRELLKTSVKKDPELKNKYKHIINDVDIDAELKNIEVQVDISIDNSLDQEEGDEDVKIKASNETPKLQLNWVNPTTGFIVPQSYGSKADRNLLGTHYWY